MRSVCLHRVLSKSLQTELQYTKLPESFGTFRTQENLKIIFLGTERRRVAVEVGASKEVAAHDINSDIIIHYLLKKMITKIITIIPTPLCIVSSEAELGQQ